MSVVEITVVGEPAPHTVQVRNAERSMGFQRMQAWQAQVGSAAKVAWSGGGHPIIGGVEFSVTMIFYFDPKQITNALPYGPDGDNCFKAAQDALQGIVFKNDSQVTSWSGLKSKHRVKGGQTVICVEPINLITGDAGKVVK